jgi:hypothetical protein
VGDQQRIPAVLGFCFCFFLAFVSLLSFPFLTHGINLDGHLFFFFGCGDRRSGPLVNSPGRSPPGQLARTLTLLGQVARTLTLWSTCPDAYPDGQSPRDIASLKSIIFRVSIHLFHVSPTKMTAKPDSITWYGQYKKRPLKIFAAGCHLHAKIVIKQVRRIYETDV